MNKKHAILLLTSALALTLAACGPSAQENSDAVLTQAAQIFSDSLTQTAAVAPPTATATLEPPTATNTLLPPTFTPTITGTPPTATASATQRPATGGGGGGAGCLRAELSWELPKDGTQFTVGERFVKIWSFKNVGTCTWTSAYSVVFIDGDLMDAEGVQTFSDVAIDLPAEGVLPGEHVRLEVTMYAPNEQGSYKGYWMLRSDNGILFGLGSDGKSWFWVDIYAQD